MKTLVIIISVLISFNGHSQNYCCIHDEFEVLGMDTINRTIQNLKEGEWLYYKTGVESIHDFTSDSCYHQRTIQYIKSKGEYKNDKKIGQWFYFKPNGEVSKSENYNSDGNKNGIVITWFSNNRQPRSLYLYELDELKQLTVYFENGYLKYQSWLKNDKIYSFDIYYDTGEIKYSGKNVEGWLVDNLKYYDKDGISHEPRNIQFNEIMSNENLIEYL